MNNLLTQAGAIRKEADAIKDQVKENAFASLVALAGRDIAGDPDETDAQELADLLTVLGLPDRCYAILVATIKKEPGTVEPNQ